MYLAAATHAWMQGNPRDGLELAELAVRAARERGLLLLEGRGHEAAGDLWLGLGELDAAGDAYGRAERAATASGHAFDALLAADGVLLALAWSVPRSPPRCAGCSTRCPRCPIRRPAR